MGVTVVAVLKVSFFALTSIFFLVDPFATIPAFLAMTGGAEREERRRMARRAAWTCFIVLAVFALAGGLIFKVFGITLPAFEIAGGVILMLIGIDMLQARRSHTQETPPEAEEGATKEDVGIIPLGIPMLAGPGAISTVMVLVGEPHAWWQIIPIFVAIAVTSLASYLILAGADRVRRYLGESGIRILMRLMGLLLTAIAVQFIVNGLAGLGLVKVKG